MNEKNTKENLPAVKKQVDLTGGIVPKDFEDLNRFAELVHRAGLSPKSFDTPAKIAVGILTNMELGRPIITGLQDLAIINGQCGIYGDASLAMVTASGLMDKGYPIETETGMPFSDDWAFSYKVKRINGPEREGRWTWIEAKRAGFDNPKQRDGKPDYYSPWRRFTRRMMQWKARNFILRDVFGDVLKGMKTVEDLHDLDGVVELQQKTDGTYETAKNDSEAQIDYEKLDAEENARTIFEKFIELFGNYENLVSKDSGQLNPELQKFISLSGEANQVSETEVMQSAMKNYIDFLDAFDIWKRQQKIIKPEKKETATVDKKEPSKTEDKSVENPNNWFRLHGENFKRFVSTHKDEIVNASPLIKDKISKKWTRIFKTDLFEIINSDDTKTEADPVSKIEINVTDSPNVKASDAEAIPDMQSVESMSSVHIPGSELVESDEWNELSMLADRYPDLYRENLKGRVFKTIVDLNEAIDILNRAIAKQQFEDGGNADA